VIHQKGCLHEKDEDFARQWGAVEDINPAPFKEIKHQNRCLFIGIKANIAIEQSQTGSELDYGVTCALF
jgi:hypothetical protein